MADFESQFTERVSDQENTLKNLIANNQTSLKRDLADQKTQLENLSKLFNTVETITETQTQQTKDIQSLLDFKDHITRTIQSNSQALEDFKNNPIQVSEEMVTAITEECLSKQDR